MTALRGRFRDEESVVGTWVSLSDPAVAEIGAELGFDFALVDTEHTANSLETVIAMARAVDAAEGSTRTVVRVPWNDPVRIKRVLDIGVAGVMVPMVGSAEEARDFVEATRYPPDGVRGVAGGRASRYGLDFEEYVRSDDAPLTVAQIETEDGLDAVEEIAAVDGLDALFVGPADLSAALGVFGEWDSERFLAAVEAVVDAADEAGVPVGTLATTPDGVEDWVDLGFDFVIAGTDTAHLVGGSLRALQAHESATGGDGSENGSGADDDGGSAGGGA